MIAVDTKGNSSLKSCFESLQGTLLVNTKGIGLHKNSLAQLVRAAHEHPNKMCIVRPIVPYVLELGMPPCGDVACWVPATVQEHTPENEIVIECATREEQCFYYADEYSKFYPFPRQVSVVVSNQCNLRCVMCPYHGEDRSKHQTAYFKTPQRIGRELLESVIVQCAARCSGIKVGNIEEPLLYPQMTSFVRDARARGVPRFHITTNGTLLTHETSKALLEGGLTSLYVSIDAFSKERYAEIRRSDIHLVKKNIIDFLKLRRSINPQCSVMTSYVKNCGDDKDAQHFLDFWEEMVDGVIFYELNRLDEASNTKLFSQNAAVTDIIKKSMEKYGRWPCLNPFQEIYILPDGSTSYCCTTIGKFGVCGAASMGDAMSTPIDEIWKSPNFTVLRKELLSNTMDPQHVCASCPIWPAHVSHRATEHRMRVTRNIITTIYTRG